MIEKNEDIIKKIDRLEEKVIFLENQLALFSQKYELSRKTRKLYEYLSDSQKKIERFGDELGLPGIKLIQNLTQEVFAHYTKKSYRLFTSVSPFF